METLSGFLAAIAALASALFGAGEVYARPVTAPPLPAEETVVVFGGDMLFDRSIRAAAEREGGDFLFSCLGGALRDADIAVANLEGPITGNPSRSIGSAPGSADNFVFTFPPETAPLLARQGVSLVSLGNNHILNFGYDGLASTTAALREAGVGYFGDPLAHTVAHIRARPARLAFVGYNEFDPAGSARAASTTIAQIGAARGAGEVPVVFAHWGEEYEPRSLPRMRELAHRFVDAGAALVIGAHPHVVEEREEYAGAYIYYSLGNLIFDQYWNDEVRRGLLVRAVFDEDGVRAVSEREVRLERDRRTCLLGEEPHESPALRAGGSGL